MTLRPRRYILTSADIRRLRRKRYHVRDDAGDRLMASIGERAIDRQVRRLGATQAR